MPEIEEPFIPNATLIPGYPEFRKLVVRKCGEETAKKLDKALDVSPNVSHNGHEYLSIDNILIWDGTHEGWDYWYEVDSRVGSIRR